MKKFPYLFLLLSVYSFSCNSPIGKIFGKRTPHEAYAEKLDDRGLDKTPEGRAWLAASKAALASPVMVSLPYRQQGVFHTDKQRALGLQFSAKAGEQLTFSLSKKSGGALPLYVDLFRQGNVESPVHAADTSSTTFSVDVDETGLYLLRLQPELFRSGGYTLSVSVGPSLSFPVDDKNASIGSVWGDGRDGGKRQHEGIDVFAPKHAPAVAAADGYVTGVREGGIGGKTVWLRPEGKNYTLYYAHLDEQLVKEGQQVKRGDAVGLVGNTGNAQFTPSHLHFGVYTISGAIDPLPFVAKGIKTAPSFPEKKLDKQLRLTKTQKRDNGVQIKPGVMLVPLAVSANNYLAEAPDGTVWEVPFAAAKGTGEPVPQAGNIAAGRRGALPAS